MRMAFSQCWDFTSKRESPAEGDTIVSRKAIVSPTIQLSNSVYEFPSDPAGNARGGCADRVRRLRTDSRFLRRCQWLNAQDRKPKESPLTKPPSINAGIYKVPDENCAETTFTV